MIDYKKKYLDALERANSFQEKYGGDYAGYIFPELRESEDERIRKFLVDYFASYKIGIVTTKLNGVRIDDILNYLEKQKINTEGDFGRGYDCGYEACLNSHGAAWFEKQKEPHFTKRNALFDKCVENCDPEIMKRVSDEVDEMLEKEQKPAEWSDEDERMFARIIERGQSQIQMFEAGLLPEHINWLKSLRNRLKQPEIFDTIAFQKGVEEGRRLEREDVKSTIQSRIDEILGDAQPNPILRMELQELIKKIEL